MNNFLLLGLSFLLQKVTASEVPLSVGNPGEHQEMTGSWPEEIASTRSVQTTIRRYADFSSITEGWVVGNAAPAFDIIQEIAQSFTVPIDRAINLVNIFVGVSKATPTFVDPVDKEISICLANDSIGELQGLGPGTDIICGELDVTDLPLYPEYAVRGVSVSANLTAGNMYWFAIEDNNPEVEGMAAILGTTGASGTFDEGELKFKVDGSDWFGDGEDLFFGVGFELL